ncbi:MAG TPA: DUF2277 domain-containing protein [Labilithrix sp.]|jgi:hypothetical protein|nr:DUF2277 domain-containing protein [Labilithrix sp.]
MCRNIRVLHHFEPPSTPEEIRAAAEQYIRKVAGVKKPAKADVAELTRAIDAVAQATTILLERLPGRGTPRTRENERERARARWTARAKRISAAATRKPTHREEPPRR